MVTPKTGRPRGRPSKLLMNDPDRYAVALSDAIYFFGGGEKFSFGCSASLLYAKLVDMKDLDAGGCETHHESAHPGYPSVNISGKSDTIRGKSKLRSKRGQAKKVYSPEETLWRLTMAMAFISALMPKDLEASRLLVRSLAGSVGEIKFAEVFLIPWLEQKFRSPDFSPPD